MRNPGRPASGLPHRGGAGAELQWAIETSGGAMKMHLALRGDRASHVQALRLVFPFDPRLAATTIISGDWTKEGRLRLPAILGAPDLGQMLLSCDRHPKLEGRLEGSRREQWVDFTLELPAPDAAGYTLDFRPLILPVPKGCSDPRRWSAGRRGWFNFIQVNAQRPAEGGHPASPSGIWANNVISDPVSSTIFWLGDHVLLMPELAPGVPLAPLCGGRSISGWTRRPRPTGRSSTWSAAPM